MQACTNCRVSKSSCKGVERPCARCVKLGLTCEDDVKVLKRSCEACRQSKVKCDLEEHFPYPCSRCAKTGASCKVHEPQKRKVGVRKATKADAGRECTVEP